MNQRWKVLFVDDDRSILDGLRRSLRRFRPEWDMRFVARPEEALSSLRTQPVDIVVADLMMPGMDGARFLCHVRDLHPDTIRFALSAQLDRAQIIGAIGPIHQFLAKPATPELLHRAIQRATRLRERIHKGDARSVISAVEHLPALADHHRELMTALRNSDVSIRAVGEIVARDMAMTAKIMQLVNSAFFGCAKRASGPIEAVSRLGIETVRSVATSFCLIDAFGAGDQACLPPTAIWNRACTTAAVARQISKSARFDESTHEQAFLAGLLHELGRLVLASSIRAQYAEVLAAAKSTNAPLRQLEQAHFGLSQGELTAYLLGLWAFEDEVVDAIMYHQAPNEAPDPGSGTLAALHLAVASLHSPSHLAHIDLDTNFLDKIAPDAAWRTWRKANIAA